MADLPREVHDLLARQDGLATRRQLLGHDVSHAALQWNTGRHWRCVLPGVLQLWHGELTQRRRQVAGLLWAGADAALAGPTAARWHGVTSVDPRGVVHLVVPRPQGSRAFGFARVRRTTLHDPDLVRAGPLGKR